MGLGLVMLLVLLAKPDSDLGRLATTLIELVKIVAAVAVLIGMLNLLAVHLNRLTHTRRGWFYSLITLVVMGGMIALRILDRADVWRGDLEGEQISMRAFEAVQVSLESALGAVLLFFLVFAAYRLMRREVTIWYLLFVAAAVVVLVGWIPLEQMDALSDTRDWLLEVPVGAGARGLLIGAALGTVMVGIRVLLGQDRSYRD